jgi:hypothetical protein
VVRGRVDWQLNMVSHDKLCIVPLHKDAHKGAFAGSAM